MAASNLPRCCLDSGVPSVGWGMGLLALDQGGAGSRDTWFSEWLTADNLDA